MDYLINLWFSKVSDLGIRACRSYSQVVRRPWCMVMRALMRVLFARCGITGAGYLTDIADLFADIQSVTEVVVVKQFRIR